MKKIFSLLFTVAIAMSAMAQLDRSVRPEAGPAPKLDFGNYKMYEMKNGLKLIVVEDHKLPRVSMSLIIDRDPIFEGKKAGYVQLAGEMLRQGTTTRPKAQLDEEIDFIGASLNTSSSSVSASGLSKYTEKLISIMADVTLNPAFPAEEFEKLKKQTLSGIESEKDDAEAIAENVFRARLYGLNHPYGEMQTKETVETIDIEDCKTYYSNYWVPNDAYIAIVGDIKAKDAKKLIKKYFGEWEMANVPENVFEAPKPASGMEISFVNKESAVQSVVTIGNVIELKPGSPDEVALRLANQILGGGSIGRLFQNIREDKAYTYGAYSSYDDDRLIGQFSASASVRNEVTDSAVIEFYKEFTRMQTEPVPAEELQAAKNFVIGSFGRSLESPSTIARFALNIERYNLPDDYYESYLGKLQAITAEQIMEVSKKYIGTENTHLVVVGKASDVAADLKAMGKLTYYDTEGNVTGEPTIPVPAGLTADSVVNTYIRAIGGRENLKKVKDITMKYDAEVSGAPMKINTTIVRKRPNMYKMEMVAAGMGTLMAQTYDGKKAKMSGMQGEQELEGEDLEDMAQQSKFDTELDYLTDAYTLKLTKIAMVGDEKAYVMEVVDAKGNKTTEYYSVESGLKIKSESTTETPQGPVTSAQVFDNYKAVNGVMYPHQMNIDAGPQKIKMTATEIKVNSGVKDSAFKL
jgi:predicted Zn-dependent peptidase